MTYEVTNKKTEMKVTVSVYLHNVSMIEGYLLKHAYVSARRLVVLLADRTATQYDWLFAYHHVVCPSVRPSVTLVHCGS